MSMDDQLIKKYGDYIARQIAQINPYPEATTKHALYELGLLRSVLAQCMLNDNKTEQIFRGVIKQIDEQKS